VDAATAAGRAPAQETGTRTIALASGLLDEAGADLADGLLDGLLKGAVEHAVGVRNADLQREGEVAVGEVGEGDEATAVDVSDAVGGNIGDDEAGAVVDRVLGGGCIAEPLMEMTPLTNV